MKTLEQVTNEIIGELITREKYTFADKSLIVSVVRDTIQIVDAFPSPKEKK